MRSINTLSAIQCHPQPNQFRSEGISRTVAVSLAAVLLMTTLPAFAEYREARLNDTQVRRVKGTQSSDSRLAAHHRFPIGGTKVKPAARRKGGSEKISPTTGGIGSSWRVASEGRVARTIAQAAPQQREGCTAHPIAVTSRHVPHICWIAAGARICSIPSTRGANLLPDLQYLEVLCA